jgi:hypothetical protein
VAWTKKPFIKLNLQGKIVNKTLKRHKSSPSVCHKNEREHISIYTRISVGTYKPYAFRTPYFIEKPRGT